MSSAISAERISMMAEGERAKQRCQAAIRALHTARPFPTAAQ